MELRADHVNHPIIQPSFDLLAVRIPTCYDLQILLVNASVAEAYDTATTFLFDGPSHLKTSFQTTHPSFLYPMPNQPAHGPFTHDP